MGYYDIPAVINFILNKTKQQQLYYVGHSQGTTAGFIAFSSWPELAERIKVFFGMGPIVTLTHATYPLFKIFFNPLLVQFILLCNSKKLRFNTIILFYCKSIRMDMYLAHSPAGTSSQNLLHWKQVGFLCHSPSTTVLGTKPSFQGFVKDQHGWDQSSHIHGTQSSPSS
uniref:AB hydrolase-1 domain-containing protein n=1 Tax=Naja naja TaxID=35670 RepID=A0A8C6XAR6_NAJNA